ncbi:MAG: hypothetical protein SFY81_12350 [Verrucomicrobiota bacterium]|nr:hypothetical protein [Verrucomicrobiota bacterium]
MKIHVLLALTGLITASLCAAEPKESVKSAADALVNKGSYSWKTSVQSAAGQNNRQPGPTEGKTEKEGYTHVKMTRGDTNFEVVMKGEKFAVKGQEGWQNAADMEGGDNRGRFMSRMWQNYKTPAIEAKDLVEKTKEIKMADGVYSGELSEEGVKTYLTMGRRNNPDAPAPKNAKGSAKFWIKDGVLSKYEYHVKGSMEVNGETREIDRTTTVEISEAGNSKVTVPEEAKKKLS